MKGGKILKNIKGYVNIKTELDLVKLNINALDMKEKDLKKYKESLFNLEKDLSDILNKMEEKLKELKGIEKELLYEIIVKGTNVTRAVDKIAFTYDMDSSSIWKNYYPNVKKSLENIFFINITIIFIYKIIINW